MADPSPWLQPFLDRLAAEDLSAATRRGYRYDLLQFVAWYATLYGTPPELARLTEHDIIAWRQHMLTLHRFKATTINRRLEAVRRLLRWAETTGVVTANVAAEVRTVRLVRIPTTSGHRYRSDAGQGSGTKPAGYSNLKAATVPI